MSKPLLKILMTAVLVGSIGCYSHTYVNPSVTPEFTPSYSRWHNHWLLGLITSTSEVDLEKVCPQGVARVEDTHTFVNGLLRALIGIVYSPTTVNIYCAESKTAKKVEIKTIDQAALTQLAHEKPELESKLAEAAHKDARQLEPQHGASHESLQQ